MEHRVVIKRHRPFLRWIVVGSVSSVLLIAAWALYTYTRSTTVSDFEQTRAERAAFLRDRQRLAAQLRKAEREVLSLKEQQKGRMTGAYGLFRGSSLPAQSSATSLVLEEALAN